LQDFYFVERDDPADVVATLRELVADRIPRRFHLDPLDEIQVLTPMRRGELGAAALNLELQALLNPPAPTARTARHLRQGDKVMQVRNNYQLEVYNGDIGRVTAIDEVEQEVVVTIDGRPVRYDFGDLDELVLAYACSIHKAQGSEYPCVVVPLHTQHYVMLQRNLLYTAVTRGRRLVVLVGSRRALAVAVKSAAGRTRWTRLAERLRPAPAR
jgi:exodeoxyribonuclease V alpha subunit